MKKIITLSAIAFCFASCFHTKKAVSEFVRTADSTGFFSADSTRLKKTDSTSTRLDLKNIVIDIDLNDTAQRQDTAKDRISNDIHNIFFTENARIQKIVKSLHATPKSIHIEIGDAVYDRSHIITVDSSSDKDTATVREITKQTSYVKNVDKKGTGIGGTFIMIIGSIILLLVIALIIYLKIKPKIL